MAAGGSDINNKTQNGSVARTTAGQIPTPLFAPAPATGPFALLGASPAATQTPALLGNIYLQFLTQSSYQYRI